MHELLLWDIAMEWCRHWNAGKHLYHQSKMAEVQNHKITKEILAAANMFTQMTFNISWKWYNIHMTKVYFKWIPKHSKYYGVKLAIGWYCNIGIVELCAKILQIMRNDFKDYARTFCQLCAPFSIQISINQERK